MGKNEKQLLEVRCPFRKRNKHTQQEFTCNNLCVKVYPPSSGETFCTVCKLAFDFEVAEQVNTMVRVKSSK